MRNGTYGILGEGSIAVRVIDSTRQMLVHDKRQTPFSGLKQNPGVNSDECNTL